MSLLKHGNSSPKPFKCRWGILATGYMASVFTKDLMVDPTTRGVRDVIHVVQAAASSTSIAKAKQFLKDFGAPLGTAAYGSYEELVADPNVDIIYVATPHSHHFQNCLLALTAGKHVLCEKPFTVNSKQAKILAKVAREKKLFLMEGMWTRFLPLSISVREFVKSGKIGEVKRVTADLSLAQNPETFADSHRMVNPDLAGGALLDLGVYSLTWVYQILYHSAPKEDRAAPTVTGAMHLYHTGVDDHAVVVCNFPKSIGIATTSLSVSSDPLSSGGPCVKIQGTNGEIWVSHPAYRPTKVTVIQGLGKDAIVEVTEFPPPPGHGFHWEADACARCIRDGRIEDETMGLEESILIMEAMDKVRQISGMRYPEAVESTKGPRHALRRF